MQQEQLAGGVRMRPRWSPRTVGCLVQGPLQQHVVPLQGAAPGLPGLFGPPEGSARVRTRAITPSPRPVRQESSVHNVLKTSKHRLDEGAETEDMCKFQRRAPGCFRLSFRSSFPFLLSVSAFCSCFPLLPVPAVGSSDCSRRHRRRSRSSRTSDVSGSGGCLLSRICGVPR